MRFSLLSVLLTGAGLIASQVAAEPLRLIVDTSNTNANIRFGHVLANANVNGNDDSSVTHPRPPIALPVTAEVKGIGAAHHWCKGALREKTIRISNAFRHALGLPLIEPHLPAIGAPHHSQVISTGPDGIHILPIPVPPFVGTPSEFIHGHHPAQAEELFASPQAEEVADRPHHKEHEDKHRHRKFHRKCKKGMKGFPRRIHKAMMTLGPWEARAVAFVLGCGIGVLLRMFWVLTVLAYRTIRGERDEVPHEHEYLVLDPEVETVFIAPPQYSDEKRDTGAGLRTTQIDV